jgi:DNA (cytosine-5)-methyltransferase 1
MHSIELFSGAGGLALGVHHAGFTHLATVELDPNSCETLRLNTGRRSQLGLTWPVIDEDVRGLDFARFPIDIELLAAGAPCQPFSLGGKHAGHADNRNMFPEVFRAVRSLQPKAFVLENVRGLTRPSFRPYFEYIVQQLSFPDFIPICGETWYEHKRRLDRHCEYGDLSSRSAKSSCGLEYDVRFEVINAADYGVPQNRERVFIVGFRRDLNVRWAFPFPTHSRDALLYAQFVDGAYWSGRGSTLGAPPERFKRRVETLSKMPKPFAERWRTVRDGIGDLPPPHACGCQTDLNGHVAVPGARSYKGHTGSPWDWPAKALKAGDHGNPGGENMLRDSDGSVRYFTIRELARIQCFPDEWRFSGSWSEVRRQLGNAVPVELARVLAASVRESLVDASIPTRERVNPELATSSSSYS